MIHPECSNRMIKLDQAGGKTCPELEKQVGKVAAAVLGQGERKFNFDGNI
jgi:hypothetical protein